MANRLSNILSGCNPLVARKRDGVRSFQFVLIRTHATGEQFIAEIWQQQYTMPELLNQISNILSVEYDERGRLDRLEINPK